MHTAVMVLAVIGVGAALVAAGCGGDDDETTTAALSKQDFVSQADAICAKGDKKLDQAGAPGVRQGPAVKARDRAVRFGHAGPEHPGPDR